MGEFEAIKSFIKMIFPFLLLISAAFCSGCRTGENNGGWICYGRGWYKFFNYRKSWSGAHDFCTSQRAVLASIRSSAENNFVKSLIGPANGRGGAWIGAKKLCRKQGVLLALLCHSKSDFH